MPSSMVNNVTDSLSNEVQMVSSDISLENLELSDNDVIAINSYYNGHGLYDLHGIRKRPGTSNVHNSRWSRRAPQSCC